MERDWGGILARSCQSSFRFLASRYLPKGELGLDRLPFNSHYPFPVVPQASFERHSRLRSMRQVPGDRIAETPPAGPRSVCTGIRR